MSKSVLCTKNYVIPIGNFPRRADPSYIFLGKIKSTLVFSRTYSYM